MHFLYVCAYGDISRAENLYGVKTAAVIPQMHRQTSKETAVPNLYQAVLVCVDVFLSVLRSYFS